MKDPKDKEQDLETKIRQGRKFSLAEAVGREAGSSLKGASPITPLRQLVLQIAEILAGSLPDSEGSLTRTIVARLDDNPPLLSQHFGDPAGALVTFLNATLDNPGNLETLVRQADARWGRDYGDQPYFEKADQSPDPDDPYTIAGVRVLLSDLRDRLTG